MWCVELNSRSPEMGHVFFDLVFACGRSRRTHHTTPHHTTPHDTTRHDTTPHHTTRHDTTPHHTTPHDTTRHDTTPHHTTRHDTTRHDTTRHHTTPHDTTRHDTTRHDCHRLRLQIKYHHQHLTSVPAAISQRQTKFHNLKLGQCDLVLTYFV